MSRPTASQNNTATTAESGLPRRTFGLREAITLIVGIVIGAGIFKTPAVVASMTGDTTSMFLAWIAGGVVSLIGALVLCRTGDGIPECRWRLLLPAQGLRTFRFFPVRLGTAFRHHYRLDRTPVFRFRRLHEPGRFSGLVRFRFRHDCIRHRRHPDPFMGQPEKRPFRHGDPDLFHDPPGHLPAGHCSNVHLSLCDRLIR